MANPEMRAGGRATETGMSFQAGVATWLAAHLATSAPLGTRFGLPLSVPVRLQLETGRNLDDIEVWLESGSEILVQCKTTADLSARTDGPLAKTIAQLVLLYADRRRRGEEPDPGCLAAVLAVSARAPRSLDDLQQACRFLDFGASWSEAVASLPQRQVAALEVFEDAVRGGWGAEDKGPSEGDLATLARLFRIERFAVDVGGADRREAARLLGERLLGSEDGDEAVVDQLQAVVHRLAATGTPTDRAGLLRRARAAGLRDRRSPVFGPDLARLESVTRQEVGRLSRHARLHTAMDVSIRRDCMPSLVEAIEGGSLMVIGEPGAGKTGVLVAFAEEWAKRARPLVFLSIDRLGNVATTEQLREELGLSHGLIDILEGWPGDEPGVLLIDALDASRGGQSERVFANLIEEAISRLAERWSVVASIRTFDLRNGARFKAALSGDPPSPVYRDETLADVRHFLVPALTDRELASLADIAPALGRVVASPSSHLRQLLRNVFNLSLAVELVRDGQPASTFDNVSTQSDLIDRYENVRLSNARLRRAAKEVVASMVDRQRLVIQRDRVDNADVDEVVRAGVLASPDDDLLSFAHHVLFDHAAGRFLLDWDVPDRMPGQLARHPSAGLLLGPALRFAFERVWRHDDPARSRSWRLLVDLCSAQDVDPIIASIALRSAVEWVVAVDDLEGLIALMRRSASLDRLGPVTVRLARFLRMRASSGALSHATACAWAALALAAARLRRPDFADAARVLLWSLPDVGGNPSDTYDATFGAAARELLDYGWSEERLQDLANQVIKFVGTSYATDSEASRALLARSLADPRFGVHAHEEAPQLADCVSHIAGSDPDFALHIYECLLTRDILDDSRTWLGGHASRIMPLSSNRRQDYEHARWRLARAFPAFLERWPGHGTRAASAAAQMSTRRKAAVWPVTLTEGRTIHLSVDGGTLQDWRRQGGTGERNEILATFEEFARRADASVFLDVVEAALGNVTASSVWARILGIGAERHVEAGDVLWPIATATDVLQIPDLTRDAAILIGAVYPARLPNEREKFEADLIAWLEIDAELAEGLGSVQRRATVARILHEIGDAGPTTPTMRRLRAEMEQAGEIAGNRPYVSITTYMAPAENVPDHLLSDAGADLSKSPDKPIRDAGRSIDGMLRSWPKAPTTGDVAALWTAVYAAMQVLEAAAAEPAHEDVKRSTWGYVADAAGRIVDADSYDPEGADQPTIQAMLELIDRLAASPFPHEPDEPETSGLLGWSNWDVRVYAASASVAFAARLGDAYPSIAARLERHLDDPAPAVRLQVAQSLDVLWTSAPECMWSLAQRVAACEAHPGVLAPFVSGPLRRLSEPEPERVEELVALILPNLVERNGEKRGTRGEPAAESVASLATRLWIGRGRPAAGRWIEGWLAEPADHDALLWTLGSALRAALFERWAFPGEPESSEVQDRARRFAYALVREAGSLVSGSRSIFLDGRSGPEAREAAEHRLRVGVRLLDHVNNQLYFGSGAFRSKPEDDPSGLPTLVAKREFLQEYGPILDAIGNAGGASTLHHLVELYEHLADADPDAVFDRVAGLLTGQGRTEDYHRESMGAEAVVRLVRRYLADHRDIFDDSVRRGQLLALLELFSGAGWPEAMSLLYELPDLLR